MAEEPTKEDLDTRFVGSSDQLISLSNTAENHSEPLEPAVIAVTRYEVLPPEIQTQGSDIFAERKAPGAQVSQTPAPVSRAVGATWQAAIVSTLSSLLIVLVLLTAVRFLLPPALESARYGWYRGQLRAEHEAAGERLKSVGLDGLSQISEAVSMRVAPSVVHLDVKLDQSGGPMRTLISGTDTQGSGVIIDADGYILTNHHVLENAQAIEVLLSDRRRVRASVVGSDPLTDLAVLKVEADGLVPIEWGDSDHLTIGSSVWAVGSPFGLTGSITFGIISSKHRINLRDTPYNAAKGKLRPHYGDLLQSDVAVNPGNSGGPLVDYQGRLIGINTAILGESYRGVSFSIPSGVAKRCYEQIRATGKVERGWLGVNLAMSSRVELSVTADSEGDTNLTPKKHVPGAQVQGFAPGNASPAMLAGLRIGDWIVQFNGVEVKDSDELMGMLGQMSAGSKVPLRVMREEKLIDLTVTLGSRPAEQR